MAVSTAKESSASVSCSGCEPCRHAYPPSDLHRYHAVIFDWDGTLVDSHPLNFRALSSACTQWGLRLDQKFYNARIGTSGAELIAELSTVAGIPVAIEQIVAHCLDNIIDGIAGLDTYQPVVDLARTLHQRLPVAIASGGARRVVEAGLAVTNLQDLFDPVITGEDARHGKPAPDLFLITAQQLGVSPAACLVYEDSAEGIQAAKAAGMHVVDVNCFRRSAMTS
ncbi:HAD family phosphatase [Dactylosporangium sp. NPDC051485]|uniref:HAD family hydrolase n=1 Tax=Dactylosporangium sp. NPDC051485 TaxID=3154846 RepID=UPI003437C85F